MSNPGETNTAPAAEGPSESALSDTTLSDFFAPETTPAAPAAEGAPAAQPAPVVPAASATSAAPAAPVVPAAPPASGTPLTSEDISGLREAITSLSKPAAVPGAETPPADPLTTIPDYAITLPPQLMEQLDNPDPQVRSKALGSLVSATMRTVHAQVHAQVQGIVQNLQQNIPAMIGGYLVERETQKTVASDFYGEYKQYDTDLLRPVVQMAFVKVVQANPALAQSGKWTPALKKAVGDYLAEHVPVGPSGAPVLPVAPAAPPVLMGTGARPASETLVGQEAQLAEMFG